MAFEIGIILVPEVFHKASYCFNLSSTVHILLFFFPFIRSCLYIGDQI